MEKRSQLWEIRKNEELSKMRQEQEEDTHEERPLSCKVDLRFDTHRDGNALARRCVPLARQYTIVSVLVASRARLLCICIIVIIIIILTSTVDRAQPVLEPL